MFDINPDASNDHHLNKLEKLETELEEKLAKAKTADFGDLNLENTERLQQIVEEIQPPPPEIEKMTEKELEAVRQAHIKGESLEVQQKRKIIGFLGWISSTLEGLFTVKARSKTLCELYGHDLPKGRNWNTDFPECPHCGTIIKDKDMLRKAVSPHNVDHS